jgi:hypothetical protein
MLAGLRRKGIRAGLLATLLPGRATELPLLPLMAHQFSLRYMFVLSAWILGFALFNGFVMERPETACKRKVRPPSPE